MSSEENLETPRFVLRLFGNFTNLFCGWHNIGRNPSGRPESFPTRNLPPWNVFVPGREEHLLAGPLGLQNQ